MNHEHEAYAVVMLCVVEFKKENLNNKPYRMNIDCLCLFVCVWFSFDFLCDYICWTENKNVYFGVRYTYTLVPSEKKIESDWIYLYINVIQFVCSNGTFIYARFKAYYSQFMHIERVHSIAHSREEKKKNKGYNCHKINTALKFWMENMKMKEMYEMEILIYK